jgi:hypothetical protein
MFAKLNRLGTKKCKVQITIHLKDLKIFENRDDISFLSIEFEKGTNKSISSTKKAWPADSSLKVVYNDPLTMVITIFQDKNGKYLEKNGKLVLKGRSKAFDGNVKMGTQVLSLHILANDYEKQDITFQFSDSKGKNIGSIITEIQAKYLGEGGDDDASSVMSGASMRSFQSVSHSDVLQGLGSKLGSQGSRGSIGSSYSEDRKAPSVESKVSTGICVLKCHLSNIESSC